MLQYRNCPSVPIRQDFYEIVSKFDKMLNDCGAKENLFRPEGKQIVALPLYVKRRDRAIGTLRLYSLRLSDEVLIVGNGGIKKTRTFEENPELTKCVEELKVIIDRIRRMHPDYDDAEALKRMLDRLVI